MLLFNGEIYNFDTIKKELKKDYNFKTKSDTEVLLAAFIKYKEKVINKVAGMFSFLVYDFKLKRFIFLEIHLDKNPYIITLIKVQFLYQVRSSNLPS